MKKKRKKASTFPVSCKKSLFALLKNFNVKRWEISPIVKKVADGDGAVTRIEFLSYVVNLECEKKQ